MWVYIQSMPSDELMHRQHKYLYKKHINGKWRYYYDVGKANYVNGNPNYGKDGMSTDSDIRGYTKFQDIMGFDERERMQRAVGRYTNASGSYENQQKMSADELYRKNISLEKSYNKMLLEGKAASDAIDKYKKTPIGKLDSINYKIEQGKVKIGKFLINLGTKLGGL